MANSAAQLHQPSALAMPANAMLNCSNNSKVVQLHRARFKQKQQKDALQKLPTSRFRNFAGARIRDVSHCSGSLAKALLIRQIRKFRN
ncbi:hypothetical protein KC19_11G099800 [Ceratodon purpureus]|uniref:Uncharacterized protein n=1 Tax=Ceratodon purpureus TaxID=3225 RepID=A0A8T0GDG7_CERPU|nr:hypothetical protein KC19_11G099800 [Ceratodon purpureus]